MRLGSTTPVDTGSEARPLSTRFERGGRELALRSPVVRAVYVDVFSCALLSIARSWMAASGSCLSVVGASLGTSPKSCAKLSNSRPERRPQQTALGDEVRFAEVFSKRRRAPISLKQQRA